MKRVTRDGGFKSQTMAKNTKGPKSKTSTPALGRYRHSSHQHDRAGSLRESAGSQDFSPSSPNLSAMLDPSMRGGSAQSAVRPADPRLQSSLTGGSPPPQPTLVALGDPRLVCSTTSPPHKGKSLTKPAYPLFSNVIGNAKGSPEETDGDLPKGGGLEKTISRGEETEINIKVPPITAPFVA
ncbi:hypothetical protein NDU88_011079 [Pleurodeles waltl]|uniref:Uncharacterized protein n=1 Tax=Pleurodeles waltl TaxID=8319 RepID=A0AAV7Q3R0_PLEWA|nr:hypothetical protein NDU88_011079 [Pleurodeles waltl]